MCVCVCVCVCVFTADVGQVLVEAISISLSLLNAKSFFCSCSPLKAQRQGLNDIIVDLVWLGASVGSLWRENSYAILSVFMSYLCLHSVGCRREDFPKPILEFSTSHMSLA